MASGYLLSRNLDDLRGLIDHRSCDWRRRIITVGFCCGALVAALSHNAVKAFQSLRDRRLLLVAAENDEFVPAAAVERLHRDRVGDDGKWLWSTDDDASMETFGATVRGR